MKSIRTMLAASLSVAFIALTLCFSVFYYGFTKNVILDTMSKSRQDSLSLVSQKVDSMLNSAYTISNLLSTDDLIIGTLMSDDTAPINIPVVKAQIDEIYSRYYKAFSEIGLSFHIICLGENGFTYASRAGYSSEDYQRIKSYSWFNKNIGTQTDTYLITNLPDYSEGKTGDTDIAVVHNVFSAAGEYKGSVLVCIPEKILENTYTDLISQNHFYILNPVSVVVSSSDKTQLGSIPLDFSNYRFAHSKNDYSIIKTGNETYFSAKYISRKTDWMVFEQIPLRLVLQPMQPILINTLILVAFSCILSFALALLISGRITRPLMEFCAKMDRAVSNQFKPIEMESDLAEIKTLNDGFNHMTSEISSLMADIHQKEKDVNDAKFNFLKAQINPHFLYNTLFSIKCTVLARHNEQGAEMISILISLLRNSISSNESLNTLLYETNYLSQYIKLQNLRYENKIALKMALPEPLMEKKMLRFLLQPLVENAIMHSYITTAKDNSLREIYIDFFEQDGTLRIEVCNNGSAFSPAALAEILQNPPVAAQEQQSHIGLRNIENRIRLLYGQNFGLYIGDREAFDTVVGICLPMN